MESISNEGMCRCCASEGTFKDFLTTYHWMGEEEIYADMLRDCFAITLYTSDDFNNGGICEVCITQLRNACNFKRQVQQTEEQFKKRVQNSVLKCNVIKLEMAGVDDGEHSDTNLSDEFSVTEFEVPIKEEKVEEKPKKRQAAKPSTSRAKKAKTEDGEPSAKRDEQIIIVSGEKAEELLHKLQVKSSVNSTARGRNKKTPKNKIDDKCMLEVEKHRSNMTEILLNSNATPIRFRGDIGYACCFCTEQFPDPADLKRHTIEGHDAKSIKQVVQEMRVYTVKLDITELKCNLCQNDLPSIDKLIDHLIDEHQHVIYTDIKNHMVPFKFQGEELKCALCSTKFTKFRNLTEHMNTHFRNYVCDVCGAGFVNRDILRSHLRIHKTGLFSCDFCSKTFNTRVKKQSHINIVHRRLYMTRKCGYCNELFDDYHKKSDHLAKYHGVTPTVLKCDSCDKTFTNQQGLRRHTRRDHLMERNFECKVCGMKFFSSENLNKHMLKHTGERHFHCSLCGKSFARKFTLKQHMRVHTKERRSPVRTSAKYLVIDENIESDADETIA
nr:zinc finger protein 37-like isoform X8 [Vanessa tameamea]